MYLFISSICQMPKFQKHEMISDYICDTSLKRLKKKVLNYAKNYPMYPKNEPSPVFDFKEKYGAVIERYCGDVLGWIVKL